MSKGMAEVRREQKAEAEAATHRKSGPPTRGSVALLVQPRRPQAASQSWAALELGSSEVAPKWNVYHQRADQVSEEKPLGMVWFMVQLSKP